jgi:hypothetical protein
MPEKSSLSWVLLWCILLPLKGKHGQNNAPGMTAHARQNSFHFQTLYFTVHRHFSRWRHGWQSLAETIPLPRPTKFQTVLKLWRNAL